MHVRAHIHTHTYAVHEQRGSYSPAPVAGRNTFHTTVASHATITRMFTACGCNNPVPGDKLAALSLIDLQLESRVITNCIHKHRSAFPSSPSRGGASKVRLPCRRDPWQITLLRLTQPNTKSRHVHNPWWILRTSSIPRFKSPDKLAYVNVRKQGLRCTKVRQCDRPHRSLSDGSILNMSRHVACELGPHMQLNFGML